MNVPPLVILILKIVFKNEIKIKLKDEAPAIIDKVLYKTKLKNMNILLSIFLNQIGKNLKNFNHNLFQAFSTNFIN